MSSSRRKRGSHGTSSGQREKRKRGWQWHVSWFCHRSIHCSTPPALASWDSGDRGGRASKWGIWITPSWRRHRPAPPSAHRGAARLTDCARTPPPVSLACCRAPRQLVPTPSLLAGTRARWHELGPWLACALRHVVPASPPTHCCVVSPLVCPHVEHVWTLHRRLARPSAPSARCRAFLACTCTAPLARLRARCRCRMSCADEGEGGREQGEEDRLG